jgi:hypothetical protein
VADEDETGRCRDLFPAFELFFGEAEHQSMIRKSGNRVSAKIMLHQSAMLIPLKIVAL